VMFVVGGLIEDLQEKYQEVPDVITYLKQVQENIVANTQQFLAVPEGVPPALQPYMQEVALRKFQVNVVVDNSQTKGAPVVIELNPTHANLLGHMEREAVFGALQTDFTFIRSGSLARANGGYLVVPVEELLRNAFTYDALKRSLRGREIVIEDPWERLGMFGTKTLRPEPLPLDVKVVLIGSPYLYQMLYALDEDFRELFKVKADFDIRMERNDENVRQYASFLCTLVTKEKLRHLDADALARMIEQGSRLAEDKQKLATRFAELADIVREADFYAGQAGAQRISAEHVRKALEAKVYRSNLIEERIREMIARGSLLVDVQGAVPGQVNGLSVMGLGDYMFGRPSRITASVGLGREGVIDIEREARLGGPIHTKGVLILGGYLSNKYAADKPLSLATRLVFEQSYEGVEGDSASGAELYSILSALSAVPIKQNFAVTGSVNQKGEVQAIGGVNHKIEGFFAVCRLKGFTGDQGVLIPESNVQNLVLREDVAEAVRDGKFHIYAVKTIDEGIEALTGVPAGERGADGAFPQGTINYLVDKRLREMAEQLRTFAQPERAAGAKEERAKQEGET